MNRYQTVVALITACSATLPGTASPRQTPADAETVVLVGAGDIARCGSKELAGAVATARLLDGIEGTVFTLGDHAYDTGSEKNFKDCYESTWGRHKARTRPSPGNHDYATNNGAPYYQYFGEKAGTDKRGFYSYDLGAWHIVSLNSNVDADARSEQVRWLRDDLKAHPSVCTLAYWHIPVFSSGDHGNNPKMEDVWKALYEFGADIVLNGHDHDYERFAPQDPKGKPDATKGIREFVVGTGGGGVYKFGKVRPNSEVHDNTAYGVLKLTLAPISYEWEFLPAVGRFRDSGSAACVDPGSAPAGPSR